MTRFMAMLFTWNGDRTAPVRALGGALLVAAIAVSACTPRSPGPGETEETETAAEKVPEVVHAAAERVARRIGAGRCETWFWDNESDDWECEFVGLSRPAELDLLPDGTFSELELVYALDEVAAVLPDEATYVRERCRDAPDVLIELSLRSESHLASVPELAEAWKKSEVVLEFQCPNGVDYEIDALSKGVMRRVDDKHDVSDHGQKTP